MFEITAEDIALLNDADLRALTGLLCEEEMRKRGGSPAAPRRWPRRFCRIASHNANRRMGAASRDWISSEETRDAARKDPRRNATLWGPETGHSRTSGSFGRIH